MSWLSDGNDLAAAECERLADSLLSLGEPGVRSYFIAAQVAYLREKPGKAISLLEQAISKYPDEKAPYMTLPVRIVARFWIGGIARHSGDVAKAKNVYETLLTILESPENIGGIENKGGVMMICNLYLAEIESLYLKRNDLALTRLEAIERIKKPAGQLGAGYDIYKGWATYQRTMISKGKVQARRQLVSHPEMMSAYLMAGAHIHVTWMIGGPLGGRCHSHDKRENIVIKTLINRDIRNTASPIDRELARLLYGFYHEYTKDFAEAGKHYLALFEEDSYFSPVAGIYLARCKKAQGKTVEADGILEQVRTKYPGYDSAVAELKKSWNKGTPNIK
jgi:tetratricopeptide (TPR) repeat protein